jgi:hypothetical protein
MTTGTIEPTKAPKAMKLMKRPTVDMKTYQDDIEWGSQDTSVLIVQIEGIVYRGHEGKPQDSEPMMLVIATTQELADKAMKQVLGFNTSDLVSYSGFYYPDNDTKFAPYNSASMIWVITEKTPGDLTTIALSSVFQLLTPDEMNAIFDNFSEMYIEGSG